MKRFALSALTVLLAAGAIAPMAQASEAKGAKPFINIHQLRTVELDRRNKSSGAKEGLSVQQRRLAELDRRNKASLSQTPLLVQRQHVLDRGSSK